MKRSGFEKWWSSFCHEGRGDYFTLSDMPQIAKDAFQSGRESAFRDLERLVFGKKVLGRPIVSFFIDRKNKWDRKKAIEYLVFEIGFIEKGWDDGYDKVEDEKIVLSKAPTLQEAAEKALEEE